MHCPKLQMDLPLELLDAQLFAPLRPIAPKLFTGREIVDKSQPKTPLQNRPYQHGELAVAGKHLTHRSLSLAGFCLRERAPSFVCAEVNDLYVYFPSLRQLHTIEVSGSRISFDTPERMEIFSPCRQYLLSLTSVFTSHGTRF